MVMVSTNIITEDGWTKMIYHGTVVAKLYHKKRINQFAKMFDLPFNVQQVHKEFIVTYKDGNTNTMTNFDKNTCLFTLTK